MIYIAGVLALITLFLVVAAFFAEYDKGGWFAGASLAGVLTLVVFAFANYTIVDAGEVIVPVRFGEVQEVIKDDGIHRISPFADRVSMPVRTVEITFSSSQEDLQLGPISALSSEGGDVATDLTILYHINPDKAGEVYENVGTNWEEVLIRPTVRSSVRDCLPRFDIEEARTSRRGEAKFCIEESMQALLGPRGIEIEEVLLRSMDVSQSLQTAINQKLEAQNDVKEAEFRQKQAEVEAATLQITRQAEADAIQIDAEARASAQIISAEADAKAVAIAAEAEAAANRVIAASLVNDQVFQLRVIEGLDLGDKTTIVDLDQIAPFLNLTGSTP